MEHDLRVGGYTTIGDILDFYCEVTFSNGSHVAFIPRWKQNEARTNVFDGLDSVLLYDAQSQLIALASERFLGPSQEVQGFWTGGASQTELCGYWRQVVEHIHTDKRRITDLPRPTAPLQDYRTETYHFLQLYRLLWAGTTDGKNTGAGLQNALKHGEVKIFADRPKHFPLRYAVLFNFYDPIELPQPQPENTHRWHFTNGWTLDNKEGIKDQGPDTFLYNNEGDLEAAILTIKHPLLPSKRAFWSKGDVTQAHLARYVRVAAIEHVSALVPQLQKKALGYVRNIDEQHLKLSQ